MSGDGSRDDRDDHDADDPPDHEALAEDVAGDAEVVALDRAYHWVVEDRPDASREHLRSLSTETDT